MWRIQISQCKELLLLLNCCCRRILNSQSWARLESLSCKSHGAEICKLRAPSTASADLQGLHLACWNYWLCSFRNLKTNSVSASISISRWIRRFIRFFLKVHCGCIQPGNTLYYCLHVGFCVQLITRGTEQQLLFLVTSWSSMRPCNDFKKTTWKVFRVLELCGWHCNKKGLLPSITIPFSLPLLFRLCK